MKNVIFQLNFMKDKFYKKGRMYEARSITGDSICGYKLKEEEQSDDEEDEEGGV